MSPEYGTLTRLPRVRNRSPLTLYSRAPENGFWRQRQGRHRRVQRGDISVSPVAHFLCRPVTHRKGRRFSGGLGARRIQDEWSGMDSNQRYGSPYCLPRSQRHPYHRNPTLRLRHSKRQRMAEKSSLGGEAKTHPPQASGKGPEFDPIQGRVGCNIKKLVL